jgi:hypothetical protein
MNNLYPANLITGDLYYCSGGKTYRFQGWSNCPQTVDELVEASIMDFDMVHYLST